MPCRAVVPPALAAVLPLRPMPTAPLPPPPPSPLPAQWHPAVRLLFEFAVVVLPCLLGLTVLADHVWALAGAQVAASALLHAASAAVYAAPLLSWRIVPRHHALTRMEEGARRAFVTWYRGGMMVCT